MGSLKGKGADLLLVVGRSLRIPGTKRVVHKFSKAVRSQHAALDVCPRCCDTDPVSSSVLSRG